jgi:predicted membrane protein (TIGR00267 family)
MQKIQVLNKKNIERFFPYFILGFQDGLVNVFGVVMAVAVATLNNSLVLLAGFAATFAESISMGAVAYTSTKAEKARYEKTIKEIEAMDKERRKAHIRRVFESFCIKTSKAEEIAKLMENNKSAVKDFLLSNDAKLSTEIKDPFIHGLIVLLSSLAGSFVPLISFLIIPVSNAIILTIFLSALSLLTVGFYKSKIYNTNPIKESLELVLIGMASAFLGFIVGYIFGTY